MAMALCYSIELAETHRCRRDTGLPSLKNIFTTPEVRLFRSSFSKGHHGAALTVDGLLCHRW